MRIGMMLRALDEKGGIGIYTSNLVHELLRIDKFNEYILYYRNPENIGSYTDYHNVTERLIRPFNKAFWDQISIPVACWKDKVDVIFHPKFTAPLLAPCEAVMVVHGADWFIPEQAQFYNSIDLLYIRTVMPLYFRKCSVVISVSQLTADNFINVLKLGPGKIQTVYLGPGRHFKRIKSETILQNVRARYNLPRKFILTLTKYGKGGDRRKNFGQILHGYARYHRKASKPHKLVVGGTDGHLLREKYRVPEKGYGKDIEFVGWIEQKDLPAIYSMADIYLHPSNLEAFPQPVAEAMACGTPLITSNVNGLKEIAGDAALFVNPKDADEIAEAINQVISDDNFQKSLCARGLARSQNFTWDKCARETLAILEKVYANSRKKKR